MSRKWSRTWSNIPARVALGLFLTLCTVVSAVFVADPGPSGRRVQVIFGIVAVACVVMGVRISTGCSITATKAGVRIRDYFLSYFYRWDDIAEFDVIRKRVGANKHLRNVLRLTLADGTRISWWLLNESPHGQGWIDDAAAELNTYISARQPSCGA